MRNITGALKDPFYIVVLLIGTASVTSIIQEIFNDHDLFYPVQGSIDRYDELLQFLGGLLEPRLRPLVAWLGERLELDLVLQSHWRQLYVLAMVFILAAARMEWSKGRWSKSIQLIVFGGVCSLVGCVGGGLIPLEPSWWTSPLMAAFVAGWCVFGFLLGYYNRDDFANDLEFHSGWRAVLEFVNFILLLGFVLGGIAAAVPMLSAGAGFAALAAIIILLGVLINFDNVRISGDVFYSIHTHTDRLGRRFSLVLIGPFLFSGLIYYIDHNVDYAASP